MVVVVVVVSLAIVAALAVTLLWPSVLPFRLAIRLVVLLALVALTLWALVPIALVRDTTIVSLATLVALVTLAVHCKFEVVGKLFVILKIDYNFQADFAFKPPQANQNLSQNTFSVANSVCPLTPTFALTLPTLINQNASEGWNCQTLLGKVSRAVNFIAH